ncbi:SGNH/GDSL hydrolase family protein [Lipingzhangella sp. LS1_29]|uniref:SGNH/GDSL hydrolase family protein n=1 Tax=Lipingzhangella rawalii TaxID=2055835 RepID=A0ABU2H8M5_9ACTN|nr:SGNH/GDSL hydrolase family protein [Lipingzhangella rawalii]MDS1271209.1 SGNH/GDSL hydrolase family protein [Lipingzhangella rawalii]
MSGFAFDRDGVLSYVALGDSFSEGLSDPYPDSAETPHGHFRGWADRLAERLADEVRELRYANLAVRGRLARQIVTEQVPRAEQLQPDLVTLAAGGNDILRPGGDPDQIATIVDQGISRLRATGAHVVLFTGIDPEFQPVMRPLRGKIAVYNMHLRAIADAHDCSVVDLWAMRVLGDARAWSWDRLHHSSEGHRRIALRVCEVLGVDPGADWREPWPESPQVAWADARRADARWAREFLVPWIGRRLTGRSSGDGVSPKRPDLAPLRVSG